MWHSNFLKFLFILSVKKEFQLNRTKLVFIMTDGILSVRPKLGFIGISKQETNVPLLVLFHYIIHIEYIFARFSEADA